MAHVVFYHSILGLRPIEHDLAREWRAAGHEVTLPDLFAGRRTNDYDEGFDQFGEIGKDTVVERALAALDGVPGDAVLAGISMGGGMAAEAWKRRPGTKGILFLSGPGEWPDHDGRPPVQMHAAKPEPFDDEDVFDWWTGANPGCPVEVFRYPDVGHLFFDPALSDYDAVAATACRERCVAFLNGL